MKYPFLKSLICASVMLIAAQSPAANTPTALDDHSGTWWFNYGMGFGSLHDNHMNELDEGGSETMGAAMVSTSVNYATFRNQLLTLRYTHVAEIDYGTSTNDFDDGESHENLENVDEIALMYGLMHKSKYFLASASAGLAYVGANYETHQHEGFNGPEINQEHHTVSTVGFPVEAQLFLTPTSFFGIGLIGNANYNDQVPYAGIMLGIQLGDLR